MELSWTEPQLMPATGSGMTAAMSGRAATGGADVALTG